MLLELPEIFSKEQAASICATLEQADWQNGKITAGLQSAKVKENRQLPESNPVAQQLGQMILNRLSTNNAFMSAALPAKIYPPLFNLYAGGESFGVHIDNAIRQIPNTSERIRTDLSCTLFFSEPDSYDGGELVIEDTYGPREVKLAAGSMVLYPGTSLHKVNPVTRGARISSFFWIQSLVREDAQRALLFELDANIQRVNAQLNDDNTVISLTGIYHNLLRRWASV